MWLLLLTAFIFYYLIQAYINKYYYWRNKGITVEVKPWPFAGSLVANLLQIKPVSEVISGLYNKFPNEKLIGLFSLNIPVLFIKDFDLIKQVTVKDFDSFTDRSLLLGDETDDLIGRSLVSLKGQRWREMRNTLSPAFTASKMRSMVEFMKECADQLVENYTKELKNQNDFVELEMKDVFNRYANDTIASTAFGIRCDSFKERENDFFRTGESLKKSFTKINIKVLLHMLMPRLMKYIGVQAFDPNIENFFRSAIKNNIKTREEQGITRNDMLSLLMQARKGGLKSEEVSEDAGFATVDEVKTGKTRLKFLELTDEDIVAQAFIFFFAGFETGAIIMSFLAYELALNIEIQRKLQNEIDENLENSNGKLNYDIIRSMKYLDMVVSETLRKWPPAPIIDRTCSRPTILSTNNTSVIIDKNDSIWIPLHAIHHDPKFYPNPGKFDPERFSEENKSNISPFTYMPFGLGPRNCIGSRFALLEVKVLFIVLLKSFDLIVTQNTEIPLKIIKSGFNLNAENGVWLGLKARENKY